MIEVIATPSHLAGAVVIRSHPDGMEPPGLWLALDRLAPECPRAGNVARGSLVVHSFDAHTVHMDEASLTAFREVLGDAPEPPDVQRALAALGTLAVPVVRTWAPGDA